MTDQDSVTNWIGAVREGDSVAATALWSQYFDQLMRQARRRMSTLPTSTYDEEDAAISTFRVLCEKLQAGAYPDLADRDELWQLLLTILIRKINRRAAYENADKRQQPILLTSDHSDELADLDWQTLTTESAEECRQLLASLDDPHLEQVAVWKLEGFTNDEIAIKLNRTRRTVQRMLGLIRHTWSLALTETSD